MRVIVGRVGRPHGIRGELVIGVRTDEPDLRFAVGATLDATADPDTDPAAPHAEPGSCSRLRVATKRWHSGQLLVGFSGITDRNAAAELTGTWLSLDSSELPALPDPDEFRDHELIGLAVRTQAGQQVGVVSDVLHHGQDLLVVQRAGGECLVPFVRAIVPEVDTASGVLVVDPPPGLLDPAEAQ
jgi:16S rRNA processing protein RimM